MKTDKELKKIAKDIMDGLIFTSAGIPEHTLPMVFMALIFIKEEDRNAFKDATLLYEYYSASGGRAVNGMPTFMSFRFLNKLEHERCHIFMKEYKKVTDEWSSDN
jgi:hypothetical protein